LGFWLIAFSPSAVDIFFDYQNMVLIAWRIRMDFKVMLTTFGMIFLAELGDKTQLATFAFAADSRARMAVFIGSALALVMTSLLAVIFGSAVGKLIPPKYIKMGAGGLFVFLGLWMLCVPGKN
jgi:putative Ca2+/H+ antiporter (TMEM165/GDT1 family)